MHPIDIEQILDLNTCFTPQLEALFKEWEEYQCRTGISVFCAVKEEYNLLHQIALLNGIEKILELGPGAGCSTMAMLTALEMKGLGSLTTVDILPEDAIKVLKDEVKHRFKRFGGDTNAFFAQNAQKFDMIYIDACHQDLQVQKDIENSLRVLNPNGIIVCHDLLHFTDVGTQEFTDIYRHVPRLGQANGKRVRLITSIGHGMGVIY